MAPPDLIILKTTLSPASACASGTIPMEATTIAKTVLKESYFSWECSFNLLCAENGFWG
jgi:hypothetical protein